MGDLWDWYGDRWHDAWRGFGTLIAMVGLHLAALMVLIALVGTLLRLLGFTGSLGRAFADGWRKGGDQTGG